jgi:hypothetical protein
MRPIPRPVRIEPAFADREQIRAMFKRYAPYRAIAAYSPGGLDDDTREETRRPVLPWFRGDWALAGRSLVDGADLILHNERFLNAAKSVFGTSIVLPELVLVNINGPTAAVSKRHLDNPSFYGATRVEYPLPLLRVMGSSGLFEGWRVVRASTLSWFYDGPGGNFDYWPDGIDGPVCSERSPFGNVALCADTDRIYHRIGPIGNGDADLPHMSAAAEIQPDGEGNWIVLESGDVRATYPSQAIRFSILWKAEVRDELPRPDSLTLDRVMAIFKSDLADKGIDFRVPSDPLTDAEWILLLQRVYVHPLATSVE